MYEQKEMKKLAGIFKFDSPYTKFSKLAIPKIGKVSSFEFVGRVEDLNNIWLVRFIRNNAIYIYETSPMTELWRDTQSHIVSPTLDPVNGAFKIWMPDRQPVLLQLYNSSFDVEIIVNKISYDDIKLFVVGENVLESAYKNE